MRVQRLTQNNHKKTRTNKTTTINKHRRTQETSTSVYIYIITQSKENTPKKRTKLAVLYICRGNNRIFNTSNTRAQRLTQNMKQNTHKQTKQTINNHIKMDTGKTIQQKHTHNKKNKQGGPQQTSNHIYVLKRRKKKKTQHAYKQTRVCLLIRFQKKCRDKIRTFDTSNMCAQRLTQKHKGKHQKLAQNTHINKSRQHKQNNTTNTHATTTKNKTKTHTKTQTKTKLQTNKRRRNSKTQHAKNKHG